jgi:hypothetical protein
MFVVRATYCGVERECMNDRDRNYGRMWMKRSCWLPIGQPTHSAKQKRDEEGGRKAVDYLE